MSPEGRGLYTWHPSHSCITSTPISLVYNFKPPTFWLAFLPHPWLSQYLLLLGLRRSLPTLPCSTRACPCHGWWPALRLGIEANASRELGRALPCQRSRSLGSGFSNATPWSVQAPFHGVQ